MRIRPIYIITTVVFSFIVFGLFYCQIIKGNYFRDLSLNNYIRIFRQEGMRGNILDRNAKIIADNLIAFDVLVLPKKFDEKSISFLSSLLNLSPKEIKARVKKNLKSSNLPVTIFSGLSEEKAFLIKERAMEFPSISVQFSYKRYYPYAPNLAHVLGYLGKINKSLVTKLKEYGYNLEDVIGYTGVEEYMDRFLRSESGGTQIQVDSRNRPVSLLGFKAPLDGQDVTLTIDIRMQQIVDRALEGYKGSIIILNPNTGEILAMASSPNFNPNVLIEGKDTTAIKDILNNPSAKLLNRAISGAYEPASTFKLVLAVVALERNMIDVNKEFDCGGVFPIGNREFKCDHVHGYQNLENAIAHSCNIYFYRLGLKLGPDLILEYARKLGYGQKTGIDLPYESNGFVLNYMSRLKKWYPGDTANLSIGQGETLVTPLQAVRFISVFANQGKLVKPFIVKSVGQVEFNSPSIIDLKLREKTLSIVRHALLMTVLNSTGTANILNISGLKVAGKTGTAQAASHKTNAWFLGFAPFMNPRISFCVFLENGGSSYYATVVTKYILTEFMKEGLL